MKGFSQMHKYSPYNESIDHSAAIFLALIYDAGGGDLDDMKETHLRIGLGF